MSKKLNLALLAILSALTIILIKSVLLTSINGQEAKQKIAEEQTPENPNYLTSYKGEVRIDDKFYQYFAVTVSNPEKIHLYPNFADKLSSDNARDDYNCAFITSAGFYTKESTPIGLFISEGRQIKSQTLSNYYNGIFYQFYDGNYQIKTSESEINAKIALQSGPILINEMKVNNFKAGNENKDRRMVLAISTDQKLILITLYKKESVFLGPTLSELAHLVKSVSSEIGVEVESAINLDGGSASAFIGDDLSLSEITPVGSFFCINQK